jgi:spore maturation protein CgeB
MNSLADALTQLGHLVYCQPTWHMDEIKAGFRHLVPDILITVGYDKPMYEASLDFIPELCRTHRTLHVYWATEDRIHFDRISRPLVQRLKPDVVWTIHPACVDEYRQIGIEAASFNFAFNPVRFPAKEGLKEEIYEIAMIGNAHLDTRTYRYESLRHLLFPLVRTSTKTNIWGSGWTANESLLIREYGMSIPRNWLNGPVPYLYTSGLYRQSGMVLGIQNDEDQITQRTFEILGTGAFMIASRTRELERLLVDGEDLVLSGSPEETLELVRYYRDRPHERLRIGNNARAKVLAAHTYKHRIESVWAQIEQLLGNLGRH